MASALLIIDIQNDYFPGGAMELIGSKAAAKVAAQVKVKFRAVGAPIINVQHIAAREGATFFLPGTRGAEIHESVAVADGEIHIVKHYPNAFRETNLGETLQRLGVTELTVVGMMTHMCVDTTVRAASDLGYKVTLISDGCATRDLTHDGRTAAAEEVQTAYLAALDGSFATVISSTGYLERA
jgi:nicotinamidase-related amidase